ncbi:hypothetical protein F4823DRAFT_183308 [Ustulina deusta]|nr:hypothetical protein F4823DRAFT_183308 [Ustulina deusta]
MVSNKGTILITGANGGLGKALVSQVLSSPELSQHHGLYTVRDETSSSSSALLSILRNAPSSHTYDVVSLDLTKPTSVCEATESINNRVAAGEIAPVRAESKDERKRKELWTASVKYTDLKVEETILANWM